MIKKNLIRALKKIGEHWIYSIQVFGRTFMLAMCRERSSSAAASGGLLRRGNEGFAAEFDLAAVVDIEDFHIDVVTDFAHLIEVIDALVVKFRYMEESFFIKDFNKSSEGDNRNDLFAVGFADFN